MIPERILIKLENRFPDDFAKDPEPAVTVYRMYKVSN